MTDRIMDFLRRRREEGRDTGPCLVVDLDVVRDNYTSFAKALPDTRVFYAVKANPQPEVLDLLARLGSCFDTASVVEIEQVLATGCPPERLSYGNTIKKKSDIAAAYARGVRLYAFDSEAELGKIADLNFQNVNLGNSTPFGQLWVDINGIEGSGLADQILGDAGNNWWWAFDNVEIFATDANPRRVIFSENFEQVPLGPNVNETLAADRVWSGLPPLGWNFDDSGVPAINDPTRGVTEWEGWAITIASLVVILTAFKLYGVSNKFYGVTAASILATIAICALTGSPRPRSARPRATSAAPTTATTATSTATTRQKVSLRRIRRRSTI
jgi:hypothetical protein